MMKRTSAAASANSNSEGADCLSRTMRDSVSLAAATARGEGRQRKQFGEQARRITGDVDADQHEVSCHVCRKQAE